MGDDKRCSLGIHSTQPSRLHGKVIPKGKPVITECRSEPVTDYITINMMDLRKCTQTGYSEMVPEHVSPATDEAFAVTEYPAAPARDHVIKK